MKTLRVAGYCRTSTESQKDNTSIPSQKEAITRFAEVNGWRVVAWYVDEAKSGSKIEGRADFQRMMKDAAADKFDLIVVFDVTRFGRDGLDILQSARTLGKVFGVHVVDTKGSFDTRDNRRTLTNYVHAGVAEAERISILERLKGGKVFTAEAGAPVAVARPFGRVWMRTGKKAGQGRWEIDPVKQAMVADAARRYLAGESMRKIAAGYGQNSSHLHRTITRRCGPVWVQRVRCKELGIDKTIETQVPPLLDEETIKAVRERARANSTYAHGHIRHKYLLSRVVFCKSCGRAMTGCGGKRPAYRYYRHLAEKTSHCPRSAVRAADIEETVLHLLFETFGNPAAVRRAIEEATPDAGKLNEDRKSLKLAEAELSKVVAAKGRIVDAIAEGTLAASDARGKLDQLKEQEAALTERVERLRLTIGDTPTAEQVEQAADSVAGAFKEWSRPWCKIDRANTSIERMPFEERRRLCQLVFGGKDAQGRRLGVYVARDGDGWRYRIRGHFIKEWGRLFPAVGLRDEDYTGEPMRQQELLDSTKLRPYQ